MSLLDYAALDATKVAPDPFPHVVVPHFLPPDTLRRVVADLPPLEKRGSFPVGSVTLGATAQALTAELEGPAMRAAIAAKFGLDLTGSPTMLTVRTWTNERDGQIHCDSRAKRVTVLLYLNPSANGWAEHQGCLRLLRGPSDLEDYAVEVPPVDGTLLAFPNSPQAWHGHKVFTGQRYSMQLNYMTTDAKARSELRRHRISAVLKKYSLPARFPAMSVR